jgi:hypothetical protein
MVVWRRAAAVAALLLVVPVAAAKEHDGEKKDVLVRVNGAAVVAAGDTVSTVVSVGDSANIAGVVEGPLVVVRGAAVVSGVIGGDVVVVNSRLDLAPGARIDGNVRLVNSQITRAPDAIVTGTVQESSGFGIPAAFLFMLHIGMTVFVLALGAALVLLAGRQISEAAAVALSRPGPTALAALITLALPALAIVAMITVIGIPLGIAIFALVIPALWLGGYIVMGTALGQRILPRQRLAEHPYGAVLLGLLILQIIWLLPFLGPMVACLAGIWGAGALIYRSWERRRPGEPPAQAEELRRAA